MSRVFSVPPSGSMPERAVDRDGYGPVARPAAGLRVPPQTARAFRGMVATSHALASEAGLRMLHEGGTAVDAAIAANLVLSVAYPDMCGVGGDLFALVWEPDASAPVCLDASGPGGSGHSPEHLASTNGAAMPLYGPGSVTVPGAPAGWAALHRRFGRLPFSRVFAEAVAYAAEGIPCPARLISSSESWEPPEGVFEIEDGGGQLWAGARLRMPRYARTLEAIGRDGPEAFYSGPTALELRRATAGAITLADLETYRPRWVRPLMRDVFGLRWWTVPPPSQGYVALLAAAILGHLDPPSDPDDPRLWHLMIEAIKAAARDRDLVLGDTDAAPAALADDVARATAVGERAAAFVPPTGAGDTVFLGAVDEEGRGVSLVQSLYHPWGSRVLMSDNGVLLQNRGSSFTRAPDHPNRLAPGRRPRSTLSPTMVGDAGSLRALIGTMGGDVQPQVALQLLVKSQVVGMAPGEALAHPRFYLHRGLAPTIWTGEPPVVGVEARAPQAVVHDLTRRGHSVRPGRDFVELAGHAQLIALEDGHYQGAADPRSGAGGVAAW